MADINGTELFYESDQSTYHYLSVQYWDDKLHEQVQQKLFFENSGMVGEDKGREGDIHSEVPWYPIIEKKGANAPPPGDTITMGMKNKLTSSGVVGTSTLKGSEQNLSWRYLQVKVELWREGLADKGILGRLRSRYSIEAESNDTLGDWLANKKDYDVFYTIYNGWSYAVITNSLKSAVTHPNWIYPRGITAVTSIDQSHLMTASHIRRCKTYARVNNWNPAFTSRGKEYFVLIMHPYQRQMLGDDSEYHDDLQQAIAAGNDHPIFTSALGLYYGVLLYEHDEVQTNSTVDTVKESIFLGGHAVARAQVIDEFKERDEDDYGNLKGVAVGGIWGCRRADWAPIAGSGSNINQSSAIVPTYFETI